MDDQNQTNQNVPQDTPNQEGPKKIDPAYKEDTNEADKKTKESVENFVRDITPDKKVRPKHIKRDIASSIRTYYSDVASAGKEDGSVVGQDKVKKTKKEKPKVEPPPVPKPEPTPKPKLEKQLEKSPEPQPQPKPKPKPRPAPQPRPQPEPEPSLSKAEEALGLKPLQPKNKEPVTQKVPEPAPPKPKLERLSPEEKDPSVRTFYSDVKETVTSQGMSIADIALQEQKRRSQEIQAVQKKEKASSVGVLLLLSLILLVGAGGIVGYLFVYQPAQVEEILPDYTTLIFPDEELVLPVENSTGIALEQKIREAITISDGIIGSVTTIVPTNNTQQEEIGVNKLGGQEFLSRLETSAPTSLVRSIEEEFVIGAHHFGDHNEQFMIFKTSFFESVFAGMLEWEPRLAQDLSFITRPPAEPGTVRAFGGEYLFKDLVVENRDTRALMNDAGDVRLIYAFPTQDTLVISSNEITLKEAFRLLALTARQ